MTNDKKNRLNILLSTAYNSLSNKTILLLLVFSFVSNILFFWPTTGINL